MPLPSAASVLATPAPGTGLPVTQPSPNPLQYNAMPGTVIKSTEYNSNFWKAYNDLNGVIGQLNGCSYATGLGVTSVVATPPLSASIGSCVAGTGTQLTLSLSGGAPSTASNFSASNATDAYAWQGSGVTPANRISIGSGGIVNGIGGDAFRLRDITAGIDFITVDAAGNSNFRNNVTIGNNITINNNVQAANAAIVGTMQSGFTNITNTHQAFNSNTTNLAQINNMNVTGTPNIIRSGTPFVIPFIAQATSGVGHLEHGTITITFAGAGHFCNTQPFNIPFGSRPQTFLTPRALVPNILIPEDSSSTGSDLNVCVFSPNVVTGPLDYNWFAIGE